MNSKVDGDLSRLNGLLAFVVGFEELQLLASIVEERLEFRLKRLFYNFIFSIYGVTIPEEDREAIVLKVAQDPTHLTSFGLNQEEIVKEVKTGVDKSMKYYLENIEQVLENLRHNFLMESYLYGSLNAFPSTQKGTPTQRQEFDKLCKSINGEMKSRMQIEIRHGNRSRYSPEDKKRMKKELSDLTDDLYIVKGILLDLEKTKKIKRELKPSSYWAKEQDKRLEKYEYIPARYIELLKTGRRHTPLSIAKEIMMENYKLPSLDALKAAMRSSPKKDKKS